MAPAARSFLVLGWIEPHDNGEAVVVDVDERQPMGKAEVRDGGGMDNENDQANRAISTGQLHALLRVHIRPIDVVVFHGSQGSTRFEVGFPLRCLQRLSRPTIATLHCGWRHNRSTRGSFIPVLSY